MSRKNEGFSCMTNKNNHTDFWSGKSMLVKGRMSKDRQLDSFDFNISSEHKLTDSYLENNDWSKKKTPKFSKSTIMSHLKKYKNNGVRKNYVNIDRRFVDDPELFKKYLEWLLNNLCTL